MEVDRVRRVSRHISPFSLLHCSSIALLSLEFFAFTITLCLVSIFCHFPLCCKRAFFTMHRAMTTFEPENPQSEEIRRNQKIRNQTSLPLCRHVPARDAASAALPPAECPRCRRQPRSRPPRRPPLLRAVGVPFPACGTFRITCRFCDLTNPFLPFFLAFCSLERCAPARAGSSPGSLECTAR